MSFSIATHPLSGGIGRCLFQSLGLVALVAGCNLQLDEEGIEKAVEACGGMTLEELMNATTINEECKASLESLLPQPSTNFSSKLVVLGSEEGEDGSLTIYTHGVDGDGNALDASAWADLQVSVSVGGEAKVLGEGEFTVTAVADVPGDLLSIGIVNDYSGSMSGGDLQTVAGIETDLFTYLPSIFEAEVTQFSSDVFVKQAFTSDRDALLDAVAYDAEFKRKLTALYDGMGVGLDSLLTRTRPLRLLIVSTDGEENDSEQYTRDELIQTVTSQKVPVVMLGALFADPNELRELAGPRGVFFYTPYYKNARAQVEQYLESLSELVAVHVPEEHRGDGPVRLEANGAEGEL